MKQLKKILIVVIGLFLTILLIYWLRVNFVLQQEIMQTVASQSFLKAIDKETINSKKALKFSKYEPSNSSDTIPYAEKMDWSYQSYLIKHDPNRLILDSLFRVELAKQHLYVPTAVRCLFKGKTVYSNSDSLFCQQAIALPLVVYRLNDQSEKRCELQGYIHLPVETVLQQVPFIGFIVFLWVLSLLFVFGYFYYRRKMRPMVSIAAPMAKYRTVTLVQTDVAWIQLLHGLLLSKTSGILRYNKLQVKLSGNGLKLFRLFISKEDFFLTSEDLCSGIFGHKMDPEVSYDRNKIITAVKRLRENLKDFTCIEIKNVRGKGYLLEIKPEHTGEPEAVVPKEAFNTLDAETVPEELAESEEDILQNSSVELTLCISARKFSTAMKSILLSKRVQIRAIQALLKVK